MFAFISQLKQWVFTLECHKEAKDGIFEAYRRCSLYDEPVRDWENLIEKGFAKRAACGEYFYVVTESGMQAVANATGLMIRYTLEFEPLRKKQ